MERAPLLGAPPVSWAPRCPPTDFFHLYKSIYPKNSGEQDLWNEHDPEDLECKSRSSRGGHEGGGRPPYWARPPISWAPRASTDLLLPPIYTHVPPNHQKRPRKPNSTGTTFCTREIPYWGLFRRPAGGGIDHGGLLHQHHSLFDDV